MPKLIYLKKFRHLYFYLQFYTRDFPMTRIFYPLTAFGKEHLIKLISEPLPQPDA
jgi:hypothetical protein